MGAAYEVNIRDISLKPYPQYPEGKVVRLMLQSGGAEELRALYLERHGPTQYFIRDVNALLPGIKPPAH